MASQQIKPNISPSDFSPYFGVSTGGDGTNPMVACPPCNGITFKNKVQYSKSVVKNITSAEVLALFTTPIEIIPAPGANLINIPKTVIIKHGAGVAYSGIAAGEDLVLKYTDASGAQCSSVIGSTGFLDQATAQIRYANGPASTGATPADVAPVANAAVVLHLLVGNITSGEFDLQVLVTYDVVPDDFSA